MAPSIDEMIASCDAALLIGDPALFLDHQARGLTKIDLGAEWRSMTGLPFVYAFWAGREGAVDPDGIRRLQCARDEGVQHPDEIAAAYSPGDARCTGIGAEYLRDNMQYGLGEPERAAIARYYHEAAALGLIPAPVPPTYFDE
jgi:chorismate dehydratase